jgi:hypothetical protein
LDGDSLKKDILEAKKDSLEDNAFISQLNTQTMHIMYANTQQQSYVWFP